MTHTQWNPCSGSDHAWSSFDGRRYVCSTCGAQGWTRSSLAFGRPRKAPPLVVPYKCTACGGLTNNQGAPCPGCLDKKGTGRGRGSRASWEFLTQKQQRVLRFLREKSGPTFVPSRHGSACLAPLTLRGLVYKVGCFSGQFQWSLTEEGERLFKKAPME